MGHCTDCRWYRTKAWVDEGVEGEWGVCDNTAVRDRLIITGISALLSLGTPADIVAMVGVRFRGDFGCEHFESRKGDNPACPRLVPEPEEPVGDRAYWVSWWTTEEMGVFELHSPWWISGELGDGTVSVCAAVRALSERDAKAVVLCSYERSPGQIKWRFVEQKADGWSPFSDRFSRAEWMRW